MNNDFDFIKDKIENSGVHAPADMDEDYVLDAIAEVQPKADVVTKKSKRRGWKIAVSATAAVLVLAITLGVVLRVHQGLLPGVTGLFGTAEKTEILSGGLSLRCFSDRNEVVSAVKDIQKQHQRTTTMWEAVADGISALAGGSSKSGSADYGAAENHSEYDLGSIAENEGIDFTADPAAGIDGSAASGSSDGRNVYAHSDTYKQVDGVDEADIIKTDGRYIYCVDSYNNGKVVIFSAEGADSKRVAVVDVKDQKTATADEAEHYARDFDYEAYYGWGPSVSDIYLRNDRLIVLCNDYSDGDSNTIAQVYDVSDINDITLLSSNTQSGYCISSRMIGDTLYTVTSFMPYNERYIPRCGTCDLGATPDEIPADCVYALEDPSSESFLVVSAFDTLNATAQTESKAILGGAQDIYCNQNNMYIYITDWNYGDDVVFYGARAAGADDEAADEGENTTTVTSQILKVNLTDGISFTAYTEVEGYIDDQYALDEYNGNLRVATTMTDGSWRETNNLYVLDENLNKLGEVTGFALDESIRAVRYMGDTAYVITYEQTDPLFVIDLSDPTAPAILGEVKITGFSTMLVPIGGDRLLGIGYHTEDVDYTDMEVTEGLKLALFDISDKENPQVLDSISYVDCHSEVQYNPKALVYNPERGDFVIPLNYFHYDMVYNEDYDYYDHQNREVYGGMLNFKVEGGKLVQIDRYEADFEEDVERCVYVGDTVYMTHHNGNTLMLDATPYR